MHCLQHVSFGVFWSVSMVKFIAIFEDLTSYTRYCQTLLILLKYRVCYVGKRMERETQREYNIGPITIAFVCFILALVTLQRWIQEFS